MTHKLDEKALARTLTGETLYGIPVAFYVASEGDHGGHIFAGHWSTIPAYQNPERLFRESDILAHLASLPSPEQSAAQQPATAAVGDLVAAARRMENDYQTSDRHHPHHVLVPLNAFNAMRFALAALSQSPSKPTGGSTDENH